jgi:hypothetical protein
VAEVGEVGVILAVAVQAGVQVEGLMHQPVELAAAQEVLEATVVELILEEEAVEELCPV